MRGTGNLIDVAANLAKLAEYSEQGLMVGGPAAVIRVSAIPVRLSLAIHPVSSWRFLSRWDAPQWPARSRGGTSPWSVQQTAGPGPGGTLLVVGPGGAKAPLVRFRRNACCTAFCPPAAQGCRGARPFGQVPRAKRLGLGSTGARRPLGGVAEAKPPPFGCMGLGKTPAPGDATGDEVTPLPSQQPVRV